jgi:hypothetical protein
MVLDIIFSLIDTEPTQRGLTFGPSAKDDLGMDNI